jgi:beta-lactamase superfamily II metal-dependent hydrolase
LTEGDGRNIGGAELVNELFGVREFWTSNVQFRSPVYRDVVEKFQNGGHPQEPRHKIFDFGETVGCWQVLWPDVTNRFSHADDSALVLLGNFQGARILLLSDLGRDGQSALLERTNDFHADIIVAGLPAEGEPLCDALLAAIQPKVIVIADSEFPATRRASRKLKDRLEQTGTPVIYTRDSGAVTVVALPGGWELRAMDRTKLKF